MTIDPQPSATDVPKGDAPLVQARVPLVVRTLQALTLLAFGVYAVWLLSRPGEDIPARDVWLSTFVLLLATSLLAAKAMLDRDERMAWAAFACGLLIWAFADFLYTDWITDLDPVPFPSISDWLYLLLYPFAYVGILLLRKRRVPKIPVDLWLDGIMVALGAAALVWLVAPSVYSGTDLSPDAVFMTAASPIADLLLLCMLIGILSVMGWRADLMWWLLLGGSSLLWITDTIWLLQIKNGTYAVGSLLDLGWPIALILIAMAAWQKQRKGATLSVDLRSALAPIVIALLSFGLLLFATRWAVSPVPVLLAAGAILVGAFRTAQVFRIASVQSEVKKLAQTDELTGLASRRHMDQRLAETLGELDASPEEPCALLLLDIDGFKEINDSFGHAAGDVVLQRIGALLVDQTRPDDTVARLGGDEFAILLAAGTNVTGAVRAAEVIRKAVAVPLQVGDAEIDVAVSIGIAMCPTDAVTRDELLRKADSAMYRAKLAGTGHAVYDPDADVSERSRLLLIHELRLAISRGEIVCDFQPKIRLSDGVIVGTEALVRWHHPTDGLLYPAGFLLAAERAGLMAQLNDRVLLIALAQAAQWREAGLPANVSVNMSMSAMTDPALPGRISDLLTRLQLPASNVCIEVAETALVGDLPRALEVLGALRSIGLTISIDDYGTGYSTLTQLRTLRATELKLDQSLVEGVALRPDVRSIVHATVELAHDLGILMVAEGVENAEDLAALQLLGCDLAQGYYICPPGPPSQISEWLRSWTEEISASTPHQRDDEPAPPRATGSTPPGEGIDVSEFRRRLRAV